jgi:hypothetical protein
MFLDAGPPHRTRPHPPTGGRGGGQRAAGAGTGRGHRAARGGSWQPNRGLQPSGSYRVAGVQAHRCERLPRAPHPHPPAGGSRRRTTARREGRPGSGPREARYATKAGHPEVSSGATAPRNVQARDGVPVKWPLANRGCSALLPRAHPHPPTDGPRALGKGAARRRSWIRRDGERGRD